MTFNRMVQLAMTRLAIDVPTATSICNRDVATCVTLVDLAKHEWENHCESDGCATCTPTDGEDHGQACDTLKRLWLARSYLELANTKAPPIAYPCDCGGTGVFYGRGVVENGEFKGHTGVCFRCQGKGWQNDADRWRNRSYDNNYRRINA